MKKFVELKTVEKGNVLVNVNHIMSIESLSDDTTKILLVGSDKDSPMLYYTVSESAETMKGNYGNSCCSKERNLIITEPTFI